MHNQLKTIHTVKLTHTPIPPSWAIPYTITLKHGTPIVLWSTLQEFTITYTVPTSYRHKVLMNIHGIQTYPLPDSIQDTEYQTYRWSTKYGSIYYHQLPVPYKGYALWSVESIHVETAEFFDNPVP